jgi:transmembrane sensor
MSKYQVNRLKRFLHPPTALAEQQALGWITKVTGSELSPKQAAEFAVWISLHQSHRRLFDELIDLWEITGELSPGALERITQVTDPVEPKSAQAEANAKTSSQGPSSSWLANLRQRWGQGLQDFWREGFWRWGLGAGLPAVSTVTVLVLVWASLNGDSTARLYETSTGGYAKIALIDGSILHLNTNTRVRVRYTPSARQLQLLGGELFIEVAKDPQRPLTVQTEAFSATAVGTAFGVAATPAQQWVEVAQGEVVVNSSGRAEYLARGDSDVSRTQALFAGEKLQLDEESSGVDSIKFGTEEVASWRGGQLFYRDIALRDLIADLNRYHRQQLVVHDSSLASIRLSAVLNSNDHPAAVAALSTSLGLSSHKISEFVTLLAHQN